MTLYDCKDGNVREYMRIEFGFTKRELAAILATHSKGGKKVVYADDPSDQSITLKKWTKKDVRKTIRDEVFFSGDSASDYAFDGTKDDEIDACEPIIEDVFGFEGDE